MANLDSTDHESRITDHESRIMNEAFATEVPRKTRIEAANHEMRDSGFEIFEIRDSGFAIQDSGFEDQGSGIRDASYSVFNARSGSIAVARRAGPRHANDAAAKNTAATVA